MFLCDSCGYEGDPSTSTDDVGYQFDVCPRCGSPDIDEARRCGSCDELYQLKDGDWSFCNDCREAIRADIEALADMYSKELAKEEFERWLEDA